jgi:hypothetical protein
MADLFDAPPQTCSRPFSPLVSGPHRSHRCQVGGGDGCFSPDHGRTWYCRVHVPAAFWPKGSS